MGGMFWGLAVKPGGRYQTMVNQSFRLTKACIVPSSCSREEVSTLFLERENSVEFIIANLSLNNFNETLDISFSKGEQIGFKVSGPGTIHLTGIMLELLSDDSDSDDSSEEEMIDELKNLNWTKQQIKQIQGENSESSSDDSDNDTNESDTDSNKSDNEDNESEDSNESDNGVIGNSTKCATKSNEKNNQQSNITNGRENQLKPEIDQSIPAKDSKVLSCTKNDVISEVKPRRIMRSGIIIEDLAEGSGVASKNGNGVGMYYTGRLKSSKTAFDSCLSGKPFRFKLGAGKVIKGWDVGLQGIKVGGKRRLTIPPSMGYGKRGAPPDIPPNSSLVFDIECKFIYGGVQY